MSRVTIKQIAAEAGVSLPTVSKVLNGRTDVSDDTRSRVESIMRQHGYQRRRAAAPSAGGGAALIDLVFHELESPWAMELIRGVETEAGRQGVEVVVSECGGARTPRQAWIDNVLARRSAGVVMVFSDLDEDQRAQLSARRIPTVVLDPAGEVDEGILSVGSNNFRGGHAATDHLISLGHRRIGMISGPQETLAARLRTAGYEFAHQQAGLDLDRALVRTGDFHTESGYQQACELLALSSRPTAIFAGSDLQALGVYRAAREASLRIPDDLSVVGYDDLPLCEWISPPLTTVHQPLSEMAQLATRLVLELSQGSGSARSVELSVDLVQRASSAPPGH